MRLTKVQITNFQSVHDSTEFDVGDVTCLVGKNEAGKTAILRALSRLNPLVETDGKFDPVDDYPRRDVNDYMADVERGEVEPARVVKATYELETEDIRTVKDVFGPDCLKSEIPTYVLTKGYSNNKGCSGLELDEEAGIAYLLRESDITPSLKEQLEDSDSVSKMVEVLEQANQTQDVERLLTILRDISEHSLLDTIHNQLLGVRIPKFLYFDEYHQLSGQDNLDSLRDRKANNTLRPSDHPLLGLMELGRIDLDRIADPDRTENLMNRLEAAESALTRQILPYWSQNRHLRMGFDIRQAHRGDPEGMRTGTNIWARIRDTKNMVSTGLGTRSRGFVWFFSFLAWYQNLRRSNENLILLLDEPGLSLHAKAQEDLLRYFEEVLKPNHQLLYTTHSPFMVRAQEFSQVRIVQDKSLEEGGDLLPEDEQGTKVTSEVLDATPDSLFPLQGALGYEIYQSLFIGPNSLVVEGVSDLLYIQTVSEYLKARGLEGLSEDWTITPVGGSDKVPTFVALIGAQTNLNVVVLIDYQHRDRQVVENLYKRKLLDRRHVITYADFTLEDEADVEDMFDPDFYLSIVNDVYGSSISESDISIGHPGIVRRLEKYFSDNPLTSEERFNHYRPAKYLAENISSLDGQLSDVVLQKFQRVFDRLNSLLVRSPSQ